MDGQADREPAVFVPRVLRQEGKERKEDPKPLSAHFDAAAIVVLGDPGAGKTELFQRAAGEEGGQMLTIRQFLRRPISGPVAQPLYLDALDEVRAQAADGHTVLDQLVGKLVELGKPKFRLSCRATDWFGGLDSGELRDASADGDVRVLDLLPLTSEDIGTIVAARGLDADVFVRRAEDDGVLDWMVNPQTLLLFLAVLGDDGAWPETRQELFARACETLVREPNKMHSRSERGEWPSTDLLNAAGQLCAAHLIAGTVGFALRQDLADTDFPFLADVVTLGSSKEALQAVTRRRLFRHEGAERVRPMHRTVAEYLGARLLVERVRGGLPLNRVLALLTGRDGGVPSELRGLYAWLTCLATEHSELLLEKDPLGVVLYGDVAVLSSSARRRLLKELRAVAERDPYFESRSWSAREFAPFASQELESELRELLESRNVPFRLTTKLLAALKLGRPLPTFGGLLLQIARDPERAPVVTQFSVQAFCTLFPERTEDLLALLDEIQQGRIQDPNDEGRHELLKALFPNVIDARKVVEYLYPAHAEVISTFTHGFLESEFLKLLPEQALPEFLDALAERGFTESEELLLCIAPLICGALARGLERFGETVPIPRLHKWLGLSLVNGSGIGRTTPERQRQLAPIRSWLENHPALLRDLFRFGFRERSWKSYYQFYDEFRGRCPVDLPNGFGHDLLELAAEAEDQRLSNDLFYAAVGLGCEGERAEEPTVEDFQQFVDQDPRFTQAWEAARVSVLDERHEFTLAQREFQKKIEDRKQEGLRRPQERAEAIKAGQDWQALVWLAQRYYNFPRDQELQNLRPVSRLLRSVGTELTKTALHGFLRSISNPELLTPEQLGKLAAKNKIPKQPYPVLAGLDLLWEQDPEQVLRLPRENLAKYVVYTLACLFSDHDTPGWFVRILDSHPAACTASLLDFWRPPLARGKEGVRGLHRLKMRPEIAQQICWQLLVEFPRGHPRALRDLLLTSLEIGSRENILCLARKQVQRPQGMRTEQYLLWLGTAFLLDPGTYADKILEHAPRPIRAGSATKRAGKLTSFVAAALERSKDLEVGLPISGIETMIAGFTRAFPHHPRYGENWGLSDEFEVPSWVQRLIEKLGARTDDDAHGALTRLCDNPVMEPWRDHLRHILSLQVRNRCELSFQQPTFAEVLETLKGGRPTNAADLFALALDHLEQLAGEIRNGSSDGYKSFWNLDSHERPIEPLPEGTCRDRLMERLRHRLEAFDIRVDREVDHADHKRADLCITYDTLAIPVECKRHGHPELWSGISDQLIPRYTRNPEASGQGIYLVFWFGLDKMKLGASPPEGIAQPTSANALGEALRGLVPEERRDRVAVLCVDVSSPVV